MKTLPKLAVSVLALGGLISTNVSAHEVTLADFVSSIVANAAAETSLDIANGVYASIARTTYHFSLEESEIKTQVLISKADEKVSEDTEQTE